MQLVTVQLHLLYQQHRHFNMVNTTGSPWQKLKCTMSLFLFHCLQQILLYKMYRVIIFFSYSFVNCRHVEYSTVRNISKILNTVFLYLLSSWSQMIISGSYTFSDIYQCVCMYVCMCMLHVYGRHYAVVMYMQFYYVHICN